MIKLHQVSKIYANTSSALIDVSLNIDKGNFVFVTGPSGAGKTTLIRLIFSSEKPTKGEIVVNDINIARLKPAQIALFRRSVGVVYQDFKLIKSKTVFENVAFALQIIGMGRKTIQKKVWQVLKWVGLLSKKDSYPPYLSGGEQQRVAIARAIINNPRILLADEPTGNLDPALSVEIMKLFKAINIRGTTVVIATHNRTVAEKFSGKIINLQHGRLINPKNDIQ